MYEKHARILSCLELLGGTASLDEITDACGIDNRTINNALRSIEPEYVTVVGRKDRWEWDGGGDPPKILSLTEAGEEIGRETSVDVVNKDQLTQVWDAIDNLRVRVTGLERANAELVSENRKLKRFIFED